MILVNVLLLKVPVFSDLDTGARTVMDPDPKTVGRHLDNTVLIG